MLGLLEVLVRHTYKEDGMAASKNSFLDFVQQHERSWGTDTYLNRPTLEQFLSSPVVVFWEATDAKKDIKTSPRYTASLHNSLNEVEEYFIKLLFRSQIELPKNRVIKIFSHQKPVKVKSVNIVFEVEGDK
jgi:hypothetical protein